MIKLDALIDDRVKQAGDDEAGRLLEIGVVVAEGLEVHRARHAGPSQASEWRRSHDPSVAACVSREVCSPSF